MEYDKEFEDYWSTPRDFSFQSQKHSAYLAWQAARKDHYRIGEEVDVRDGVNGEWVSGYIVADTGSYSTDDITEVRRIPAWTPKEGEAVIFPWYNSENVRVWCAGVYSQKMVYFGDDYSAAAVEFCRPLSADKIGRPWEEI